MQLPILTMPLDKCTWIWNKAIVTIMLTNHNQLHFIVIYNHSDLAYSFVSLFGAFVELIELDTLVWEPIPRTHKIYTHIYKCNIRSCRLCSCTFILFEKKPWNLRLKKYRIANKLDVLLKSENVLCNHTICFLQKLKQSVSSFLNKFALCCKCL